MRFSINCPTVVCLPNAIFMREMPLVKTMAPRSILIILLKPKITCYSLFTLQFIYHLLSDLIIATLLPALGASICSCVCTYHRWLFAWISYWFDNLGSLLREILSATILLHPSSSGENPTQLTSSNGVIHIYIGGTPTCVLMDIDKVGTTHFGRFSPLTCIY